MSSSDAWVICADLMSPKEKNERLWEIRDDLDAARDRLDGMTGWDGNAWSRVGGGAALVGGLASCIHTVGWGCAVAASGGATVFVGEAIDRGEIEREETIIRQLQRELDELEPELDKSEQEWRACLSHYEGKRFFGP